MLPFQKKKEASVSAPVEVIKRESDEPEEYDYLESCGHDLLSAVEAKDPKGIAVALRAAFEICDSQPHEEGPHV